MNSADYFGAREEKFALFRCSGFAIFVVRIKKFINFSRARRTRRVNKGPRGESLLSGTIAGRGQNLLRPSELLVAGRLVTGQDISDENNLKFSLCALP